MRSRTLEIWLVALVAAGCVHHDTVSPERNRSIARAVFAAGRVWLLTDSGGLSTIREGSKHRTDAGLLDPVLDVCVHDGEIDAATCARKDCSEWSLRRYRNGRWSRDVVLAKQLDERWVGWDCASGHDTLITTRRILELQNGKPIATTMLSEKAPGGIRSVLMTDSAILVGFSWGEWGGGLLRIDRSTGKVTKINGSNVNAITIEPWKPQCVAVAVGVVHFFSGGRILEVCDDRVQRLFFKGYGKDDGRNHHGDEPFSTVAFFGLEQIGNELWAMGIDGIYVFAEGEEVRTIELPEFETIDDVAVSFALPHAVLVLTMVNQRNSMSGATPLLVAR